MTTAHVEAYFNALSTRDNLRIVPHLADDIVLRGPIFPEPTLGKDAVVEVLTGFLETIDTLEVKLRFASDRDVAVFFSFTCDGVTVDGNEHLHLNENGFIDQIEVAWRPLPSAVLVQEVFANKLGFAPMRLVPASEV
ncbi:nuclear transport factor 2 family protein [Phenylobacterium deserti]|uniref:Nuclear transport factor 2 family protein n=1 Tax=Phenylobacterium deserti TaxID=1914756 RepID=A0A328ADT2_9CAUL|nr:nuclear transport factor 2 family protein [Phenylobacterium deserti]RAK52657.1 nuclear transport factor 2 family protein [Phenylobacterium deserti]